MLIRLAREIEYDSIVDGEGLRAVIWTQGCIHNCPGCHNAQTHSLSGGFLKDIEEIKNEINNLTFQDGITLSGGDPILQIDACLEIAKYAQTRDLNVWCYTGYTFEQLLVMTKTKPNLLELLQNIDVLVDGKFILDEKSLNLKFKGSRNQRIIDVKKSLKSNKAMVIPKYETDKEYKTAITKSEHLYV